MDIREIIEIPDNRDITKDSENYINYGFNGN